MIWYIYLRKGLVFVPTVSRTEAGYYMDINPVAVHAASDYAGIVDSILTSISRGNPVIATPSRGNYPAPVILAHAQVKSWGTFEKSAVCWKVRLKESEYQLCLMRKSHGRGWEDDPAKTENHATPSELARRICELIATFDGPQITGIDQ